MIHDRHLQAVLGNNFLPRWNIFVTFYCALFFCLTFQSIWFKIPLQFSSSNCNSQRVLKCFVSILHWCCPTIAVNLLTQKNDCPFAPKLFWKSPHQQERPKKQLEIHMKVNGYNRKLSHVLNFLWKLQILERAKISSICIISIWAFKCKFYESLFETKLFEVVFVE